MVGLYWISAQQTRRGRPQKGTRTSCQNPRHIRGPMSISQLQSLQINLVDLGQVFVPVFCKPILMRPSGRPSCAIIPIDLPRDPVKLATQFSDRVFNFHSAYDCTMAKCTDNHRVLCRQERLEFAATELAITWEPVFKSVHILSTLVESHITPFNPRINVNVST